MNFASFLCEFSVKSLTLAWSWSYPLTGEVEEAIHHRVGDDTAHGQEVEHSKDDQQCLVTGGRVGLEYKLRLIKQQVSRPPMSSSD